MQTPSNNADRTRRAGRLGEVGATLVFLVCVAVVARHTRGLAPSGDTQEYQASVRSAFQAMPREVGEWSGIDVPVPSQAQDLLRPTAFLSRQYVNRNTGETCSLTLIHCGDARNMLDHFPPNCYPGQGWVLQSSVPADLATQFGTVHAMEYEFSRGRFGASTTATVTNAMLLPNGTSDRDMSGVERMMGSQNLRFFGVAQVQVYFEQSIAPARRRQIVLQMLDAHKSCILPIVRQQTI